MPNVGEAFGQTRQSLMDVALSLLWLTLRHRHAGARHQ